MAHYAFLDKNNIVTEVITGRNENEIINGISDWETYYGNKRGLVCKQWSYNNNPPRGRAGIGSRYDENRNCFFPPAPFESWTWNEDLLIWQPPIPKPTDGNSYLWNEDRINWDIV